MSDEINNISDLQRSVEFYMEWLVNGDVFEIEQDFEDDLREYLSNEGFDVLDKQNVENTNEAVAGRFFSGRVEDQIPDIAVDCFDGLVFLELKYCDGPALYNADVDKVNKFLEKDKCQAAGVLFLDNVKRDGWKVCRGNNDYNYYFEIGE